MISKSISFLFVAIVCLQISSCLGGLGGFCASSPCLNSGVCTEDVATYICNCSETLYIGNSCEFIEFPLVGYAQMKGTANSPTSEGSVTITQMNSSHAMIAYDFVGLVPGLHSLHIHDYGDVSSTNAMYTGGHFNPTGTDHGCWPTNARHAGDLFNISAASDGTSSGRIIRELIYVTGDYSGIGRAIVLHETFDDCQNPTGNAGARHAQGVIGIANGVNNTANGPMTENTLMAYVTGTTGYETIKGKVYMYWDMQSEWVHISINFTGLTPNHQFGIHIHEFGDPREDGVSCGGHYNPTGNDHGLPTDVVRHQGDLGNITSDANGALYVKRSFELLSINNASLSNSFKLITGRGIILHADADDGGQPTGNAGGRIAVGVIGTPSVTYFPYTAFGVNSPPDPDQTNTGGSQLNGASSISSSLVLISIISILCFLKMWEQ